MRFSVFALLSVLLPFLQAQASTDDEVQQFLDWYWQRPLPAQGSSSYQIGELPEPPLAVKTCGQCHPSQFGNWQKSRHARSMGPGILGQLVDTPAAEIQFCLDCHAPLKEQALSLDQYIIKDSAGTLLSKPNRSKKSLYEDGVMCSVCHVRGYQWFGPTRASGTPSPGPMEALPHEGWKPQSAFEDSRFCAACHQFPKDGYALKGKLLENTYEEWKASPQAQQGLTCQGCHMEDRRHLWRGIHDSETVRSGVDICTGPVTVTAGSVRIDLSLTNTKTGHSFPTYLTPKVTLQVHQENAEGHGIPNTLQQYVIAREVSLDLSEEMSDTRLSPGQIAILKYEKSLSPDAIALVANVEVEPDAFYSRFYQALLETGLSEKSGRLIQQALAESMSSSFSIYLMRHRIPR